MEFEEFIDYLTIIVEDIVMLFDSVPIAGTTLWRLSIGIIIFLYVSRFMPIFDDEEEED